MATIVTNELKTKFLNFCREIIKSRGTNSCVLAESMVDTVIFGAMVDATAGPILRDYCSKNGFFVGFSRANRTITITKDMTASIADPILEPEESVKEFMVFGDGDKYFIPYCFYDILKIVSHKARSHNVYLSGPTACGKSLLVMALGNKLNRKVFTVNCNGELRNGDIYGALGPVVDKSTGKTEIRFIPGIIEQAMTEGLDENGNEVGEPGILYFDEFSSIPDHIGIGLNRFLESNQGSKRELIVKEDGGRVVKSHSGLRIIAAGNTNGRGNTDIKSMAYTAQSRPIDISLLRRFSFSFKMGYDKLMEKNVVESIIPDVEVSSKILAFRDGIRKALKENELTTPFGTSHLVAISQGYNMFGSLEEAIGNTIFCFLLEEEIAVYDRVANLCFGGHIQAFLLNKTKDIDV